MPPNGLAWKVGLTPGVTGLRGALGCDLADSVWALSLAPGRALVCGCLPAEGLGPTGRGPPLPAPGGPLGLMAR